MITNKTFSILISNKRKLSKFQIAKKKNQKLNNKVLKHTFMLLKNQRFLFATKHIKL